jgi:hypothetical protein
MKDNKQRLFEMMNKVGNAKYPLNEGAEKGTRVMIKDVSPQTIDVQEVLPSHDTGDAGETMLQPEYIDRWKQEFISKFGDEGYIEKGIELPWKWDVVGNEKYEQWKNNYMTSKGNYLNRERQAGRSID